MTKNSVSTTQPSVNLAGKPTQVLTGAPSTSKANPFAHPMRQIDIKTTVDKMLDLFSNHCVMSDDEKVALVLWAAAGYLINSFSIFGKVALISPEKRCGKTTAMAVLGAVCKDSLLVSNLSSASVFRAIDKKQITLLIDEADELFKRGDTEITSIINSSLIKASSRVMRCQGKTHEPKWYSTWTPIGLASIQSLPDTVMDRSIVINLRRKLISESVAGLPSTLMEDCKSIRDDLARWCEDNEKSIKNSTVTPPNVGNDRAADIWRPLFQVASVIGADWPDRCKSAYKALTKSSEPELPTQLLYHIREILSAHPDSKIGSTELVKQLCAEPEWPWSTLHYGKALTTARMASMLKPYSIYSANHRFPEGVKKGYEKSQFKDAFKRYL